MTVLVDGRVRRADLMHAGDYPLVVTARFAVNDSEFTAHIADEDGLSCPLAAVTRSAVATSPVRLFLMPQGYRPAQDLPIEAPPSALYFDVDQEHQVAAAGMLVAAKDGGSYRWRTRGDTAAAGVVLAQDPYNPDHTPFPQDSYITTEHLYDAVFGWAFGEAVSADFTTLAGGVRMGRSMARGNRLSSNGNRYAATVAERRATRPVV